LSNNISFNDTGDQKEEVNMKSITMAIVSASLLIILSGFIPVRMAVAQNMNMPTQQYEMSPAQIQFRDAMNKLWDDHVSWTRLYIVSALAGLPDKDAVAQRLLQNQTDIGNAIKPYYGDAAGNKLTELLRTHILTAGDIITYAKSGDNAKMQEASNRWYANADEIASFLSGANPQHWPMAEMKKMMHDHLDLTAQELSYRLKGDWPNDIATFDKVHTQILQMADMLSSGIIEQFSIKFTSNW
jgi:hypothetical protein